MENEDMSIPLEEINKGIEYSNNTKSLYSIDEPLISKVFFFLINTKLNFFN